MPLDGKQLVQVVKDHLAGFGSFITATTTTTTTTGDDKTDEGRENALFDGAACRLVAVQQLIASVPAALLDNNKKSFNIQDLIGQELDKVVQAVEDARSLLLINNNNKTKHNNKCDRQEQVDTGLRGVVEYIKGYMEAAADPATVTLPPAATLEKEQQQDGRIGHWMNVLGLAGHKPHVLRNEWKALPLTNAEELGVVLHEYLLGPIERDPTVATAWEALQSVQNLLFVISSTSLGVNNNNPTLQPTEMELLLLDLIDPISRLSELVKPETKEEGLKLQGVLEYLRGHALWANSVPSPQQPTTSSGPLVDTHEQHHESPVPAMSSPGLLSSSSSSSSSDGGAAQHQQQQPMTILQLLKSA